MQIPKIIHQIWLGGGIPEKYLPWMNTWKENHPEWTYIVWTDQDLAHLELQHRDLLTRASNYGEKADILRLELIDKFGGLYIDTDYQCNRPFDAFHERNLFYASALAIGDCGFPLNNALIGSIPHHPLIDELVRGLRTASKAHSLSERTGPIYFTRTLLNLVARYPEGVVFYPPRYFTPGPQDMCQSYEYIKPYATHWFVGSWLHPQGNQKRFTPDTRIERLLTPIYLAKKEVVKIQDSNRWLDELVQEYALHTIVECGATQFLVEGCVPKECNYYGISPVKFLVLAHRLAYPQENRAYFWRDWTQEKMPHADLLILGDTLEYLSFKDSLQLLQEATKAEVPYILIASNQQNENSEPVAGDRRSLNMCKAPFNFPAPKKQVRIQGKTYCLWYMN